MSSRSSRYAADINLQVANDPHVLAIARVPANSRVLDLGVADGSVARVLQRMGCRVWGVDNDPVAAKAAEAYCEEVTIADLNTFDLVDHFGGRRFNVILMLDVLEHLTDPVSLLQRVAPVLDDGGWGVISLPNVAHASVRLALLEGRFTYTDVGLLDRTHLRFFDRTGVAQLFRNAGWQSIDMARVLHRAGGTEIAVDGADPELVQQLESDIEGLTYQFVMTAVPDDSPVLRCPPVLPAAAAYGALLEALAEHMVHQQSQVSLQSELATERDSMETQLEALHRSYQEVDEELQRLRNTKLFRWSAPARKVYASLRQRSEPAGLSDPVPATGSPDSGWSRGLFDPVGERYVELLMHCVTRTGFGEVPREVAVSDDVEPELRDRLQEYLENHEVMLVSRRTVDPAVRDIGGDWPSEAETMIGMQRLRQFGLAVGQAVAESVEGDVLEAGVWRGGACILARGALEALSDPTRKVWVADSFRGLPKPDPGRYPADEGDPHWTFTDLIVGRPEVEANFARYGLLDERVRFLEGWFEDTLPSAPIERLAVLRIDGDMYGSTTQALEALYPRLSPGGFCIVDDYGAIAGCRAAVDDFRRRHGVTEPIEQIDWTGIVWRKGAGQ